MGHRYVRCVGHLLEWGDLTMPATVAADVQLKGIAKDLHESIGTAFYTVIGLHAMAALFHHYMLGDNTLRRMWRSR
ncbi:cytochrome b [Cupriavidus pauculus]|uniref:cytochrome b n=2 Tax=Cupriavidus pauculus TaxID=82633 RepID=UPI003C6DB489